MTREGLSLFQRMAAAVDLFRGQRRAQLLIANLRIFIGFGVLPAAIKKLLDQPFTDAHKTGAFHDFLHAFYAVKPLYFTVGAVQLAAALALMTQRFAHLGAALLFPVMIAITALCWASHGVPTLIVVHLMSLGLAALLLWDYRRWFAMVLSSGAAIRVPVDPSEPRIATGLWEACGLSIASIYVATSLAYGGIYRPRGLELDEPAFYLLPALLLLPLLTFVADRRRQQKNT